MANDGLAGEAHQLGIARRQALARDADIVFEARAHRIGAARQRPFHHPRLLATDAGGGPGGLGQKVTQFAEQNVQKALPRRQGILDAHDELHMRPRIHQPGLDEARRAGDSQSRTRVARERAYRFMAAMAGDLPGFEEATRALFAGDGERFAAQMAPWPQAVRDYALRLSAEA